MSLNTSWVDREREGMECSLCDDMCESVSHRLWECLAYSSLRKNF